MNEPTSVDLQTLFAMQQAAIKEAEATGDSGEAVALAEIELRHLYQLAVRELTEASGLRRQVEARERAAREALNDLEQQLDLVAPGWWEQ